MLAERSAQKWVILSRAPLGCHFCAAPSPSLPNLPSLNELKILVLHPQQPRPIRSPPTPMSQTPANSPIPLRIPGEGGKWHPTLPGIPRNDSTQTLGDSQESVASSSSSGEEEGDSESSADLLSEGCATREPRTATANQLRRLYFDLSRYNAAASYHYDQYRFAVSQRNIVQLQIQKIKKGRTSPPA